MARKSWDEYFSEIAEKVATRGTCPRARVGAIAVKNKRIIATAYNGSLPGHPHCDDVGCLIVDNHCVRSLHAEENLVAQAAYNGVSLAGATIYLTLMPCLRCAKLLISAGIKKIVYSRKYDNAFGKEYLEECFRLSGIELIFLSRG